MKDPKCRRFYRVCGDFSLCVNIGDKGYVLAEHPNERYTTFYYGIRGSGKFAKLFEEKYLTIERSRLLEETTISNEVIAIIILCVCSVIALIALIYCCLKKRR